MSDKSLNVAEIKNDYYELLEWKNESSLWMYKAADMFKRTIPRLLNEIDRLKIETMNLRAAARHLKEESNER